MKIILACALTALATGTLTAGGMSTRQHPARTPYASCIAASNRAPYFATEVCEPLMPGYREPQVVRTGPITRTEQDATITLPPLAEDVADSCPDPLGGAPDLHAALLDCARAVIADHQAR